MENPQRKPGFTYIFSETLNQEIAISDISGKVYCSDGVQYTPAEINQIRKTRNEIPIEIHLLKKHFGGTVIYAEDKHPRN